MCLNLKDMKHNLLQAVGKVDRNLSQLGATADAR